MVITQENLLKQIADREDIDVATVRKVFKSAEGIIFDHLSSLSPREALSIKPFKGFTIDRQYRESRNVSRGLFTDVLSPEHVLVKSHVSKYYNSCINDTLFE